MLVSYKNIKFHITRNVFEHENFNLNPKNAQIDQVSSLTPTPQVAPTTEKKLVKGVGAACPF